MLVSHSVREDFSLSTTFPKSLSGQLPFKMTLLFLFEKLLKKPLPFLSSLPFRSGSLPSYEKGGQWSQTDGRIKIMFLLRLSFTLLNKPFSGRMGLPVDSGEIHLLLMQLGLIMDPLSKETGQDQRKFDPNPHP